MQSVWFLLVTCRTKKKASRAAALSFPPEVWQLIACQMSMTEWARVSGICRTTWELQLDEINLTMLEKAAGVYFCCKITHLHSSRPVCI